MGLATTCQARAGVGEEEVTHINSNNNCLKNLRNARDLGLIDPSMEVMKRKISSYHQDYVLETSFFIILHLNV